MDAAPPLVLRRQGPRGALVAFDEAGHWASASSMSPSSLTSPLPPFAWLHHYPHEWPNGRVDGHAAQLHPACRVVDQDARVHEPVLAGLERGERVGYVAGQ